MSGINEMVYIELDVQYEGEDFYLLVMVSPYEPKGYETMCYRSLGDALGCFRTMVENGVDTYVYEVSRTWEDGTIEQVDLTECFYALIGV